MKNHFTFIAISCLLFSCKNIHPPKNETTSTINDTVAQHDLIIKKDSIENFYIDSIYKIPEIQAREDYIQKHSNGNNHLVIWSLGADDEGVYEIHIGEDNGESYVTWDVLHIYPSHKIMLYDLPDDTETELTTFKNINKDRF